MKKLRHGKNGLNRKDFLLVIALLGCTLLPLCAGAQTGPGGVGTTDGTSNLSLWLNAGTITGVSDGANMGTWNDQSGNGYDALVGTKAPNYSATGGGNGQPALTFDASNTENMYVPTNAEVMPTNEVTAFVLGNYDAGLNKYAGLISTSDDDGWNDGWAIARDNGTSNTLFYCDDYAGNVCSKSYPNGVDKVWNLIFNTTANMGYGYKNENGCSFAFNGPLTYNGGANDNVLIGAAPNNGGPGYYLEGDISEVIIYNVAINDAQRIIIANYLSAKYNTALTSNDCYDEDNAGNGNFDFEVAGIGRVNASNIHNDSQGTGIVRILNPTGLGNDEFFIWGHNNDSLEATDTSDIPTGVEARLARQWRVSETNAAGTAVDVGSIDIRFDLTGLGDVTVSDLRLLVDTDDDGIFSDETPISGATSLGSNIYQFAAVSAIGNNMRFSLGTINKSQTPLPIELIGFSAKVKEMQVVLNWETGSETNFSHFMVERSTDGRRFEKLGRVESLGYGNQRSAYTLTDPDPARGVNYYRLRQVDSDASFEFSQVIAANVLIQNTLTDLRIFPNPSSGSKLTVAIDGNVGEEVTLAIFNAIGGQLLRRKVILAYGTTVFDLQVAEALPSGTYTVVAQGNTILETRQLLVK